MLMKASFHPGLLMKTSLSHSKKENRLSKKDQQTGATSAQEKECCYLVTAMTTGMNWPANALQQLTTMSRVKKDTGEIRDQMREFASSPISSTRPSTLCGRTRTTSYPPSSKASLATGRSSKTPTKCARTTLRHPLLLVRMVNSGTSLRASASQ